MSSAPRLIQAFADPKEAMRVGRSLLTNLQEEQWRKFESKTPIQHLISERTNFIDQLLKRVWKHYLKGQSHLCLVAVGGYGRGELHPYSDIDILILSRDSGADDAEQSAISAFITYLWDIGLQVGHAIRTLEDCYQQGKADLSTATNYTEARWLIGHYDLFDRLRQVWQQEGFWSSKEFFLAKVTEQEARYAKAQDALAQLEPNIKESPGGLRDIHTLLWVAKRHFGANSLQQLVSVGYLSVDEYNQLERAMRFHWRVRFVLHSLKKRKEERLLFEHQKQLAEQLGYTATEGKLAVENFMQDYYRNAKIIRNLNKLLLQVFREQLLLTEPQTTRVIDDAFSLINEAIAVQQETLFVHSPIHILMLFVAFSDPQVKGIRADTQRLINRYAHLINESFCQQAETWQIFRQLLNQPRGVFKALQQMHQHGLLGRLLPAFHRITGLMQFDLFHAYTVDEHTLLVVKNLRKILLAIEDTQAQLPLACRLGQAHPQADILLLAGLFHDIAKGQGGAHEVLGAEEANQFAKQAQLTAQETEHLTWLVAQHLLMSHTAQKQDLSDPEVIARFCQTVNTPDKLRDLYLLTVADVRSTSPVIWNSWKDNLLQTLYHRAFNHLTQHNLRQEQNRLIKQEEQSLLHPLKADEQEKLITWWQALDASHYRQHIGHNERKQHLDILLADEPYPRVRLTASNIDGICKITLLAPDNHYLWLILTRACYEAQLNILSAEIYTTQSGIALIDLNATPAEKWSEMAREDWQSYLIAQILHPTQMNTPVQGSYQGQLRQKSFDIPTQVLLNPLTNPTDYALNIIAKDHAGLLFKIAQVLADHQWYVESARITTEGIRAEDYFVVGHDTPDQVTAETLTQLTTAIQQALR
jgi:[protein-PII] uridylyltransferase